MKKKYNFFPYILMMPLAVITISFIFYPLLSTCVDSFRSIDLINPSQNKFVGIDNYINIFKDRDILISLKHSLSYLILAVFLEISFGILFSISLYKVKKHRSIIIAILILPWAFPPVVNGVIWKWIYDPSYGLLNDILNKVHIINNFHVWLSYPNIAKFLIILVHVYKIIPLCTIIFLAQLETIPKEVYEAAAMDGANEIEVFKNITLPFIKPAILICLTQGTFSAFHLFDEIYVLTGTDMDTRSLLIQNYLISFRNMKLSKGMALSLIISIIPLAFILLYKRILSKEKEI